MPKKEGRIVATGVNPQGVPWKEISFVEKREQGKIKGNIKEGDTQDKS